MKLKFIIFIFILIFFKINIYTKEYEEYNLELKKILNKNKIIELNNSEKVYFENFFNKINNFKIRINSIINKNLNNSLFKGSIKTQLISSYNYKNVKIRYNIFPNKESFLNYYIEQDRKEIKFIIKVNFSFF